MDEFEVYEVIITTATSGKEKAIENALDKLKYAYHRTDWAEYISVRIKEDKTDWKEKIKLDRLDLISMAKGIVPNPSIMDDYPIYKLGSYLDNQGWQWNWDAFNDLSEIDIYNIYVMCKNSWK